MSADAASGSGLKLTRTQWLICFIATIGFLFDIYELLMLPLIAKSALLDIAGIQPCLLYTSPSPRDATLSRMPSSA